MGAVSYEPFQTFIQTFAVFNYLTEKRPNRYLIQGPYDFPDSENEDGMSWNLPNYGRVHQK